MRSLLRGIDDAKRQRKCQHQLQRGASDVGIVYDPVDQKAWATGLFCCGNEDCAYCSWRDREEHRREIAVAYMALIKAGGAAAHLITTFEHHADEWLEELFEVRKKARRAVMKTDWWLSIAEQYEIYALTSCEETFGENGWHPHGHDLLFMFQPPMAEVKHCPTCSSADLVLTGNYALCRSCEWQGKQKDASSVVEPDEKALLQVRLGFAKRYCRWLARHGHNATDELGVQLKWVKDIEQAEYLADKGHEPVNRKYDVSDEMTMGAAKETRDHKGMTPFQLQDAAGGDDEAVRRLGELLHRTDRNFIITRAGALCVEHWRVKFRRHRLQWEKGLKERLGFKVEWEKYEAERREDLAQRHQIEPVSWCWVDERTWSELICGALTGKDRRAEFFSEAGKGDPYGLATWLRENEIEAVIPQCAYEYAGARASPD